jgi:hypothetical protein
MIKSSRFPAIGQVLIKKARRRSENMKTKSAVIGDEALARATGKTWRKWQKVLRDMGADSMPHKDIAARLVSDHDLPGWWAQGITVRYEQEIGRRKPGQNCYGEYSVTVSATVDGSMDDALAAWSKRFNKQSKFDGVPVTGAPVTSRSEKWRYWRVKLQGGTRVNINFGNKPGGKALIQIQHEKLPDQAAIEHWRAYWKNVLTPSK